MKYLEFSVTGFLRFNGKRGIAINMSCTTKAYEKNCMHQFGLSVDLSIKAKITGVVQIDWDCSHHEHKVV